MHFIQSFKKIYSKFSPTEIFRIKSRTGQIHPYTAFYLPFCVICLQLDVPNLASFFKTRCFFANIPAVSQRTCRLHEEIIRQPIRIGLIIASQGQNRMRNNTLCAHSEWSKISNLFCSYQQRCVHSIFILVSPALQNWTLFSMCRISDAHHFWSNKCSKWYTANLAFSLISILHIQFTWWARKVGRY